MITAQKRPKGHYIHFSKTENRTSSKSEFKRSETVLSRIVKEETPVDQGKNIPHKERVGFHFTVAASSPSDFTLVKGLIEFHRPKEFLFQYDRKQNTISLVVELNQIDPLATFLLRVEEWVRKEKRFRHALRIALDFEKRYQLEQESVYAVLKNSVAPNVAL